jgi:hypothetical protein
MFPPLGPRRKIKTRRTVPRPGLLFIIHGQVSFRCGPGCHVGLCLVHALLTRSSSNTADLLHHPSTVRLHHSKPSSKGPLGQALTTAYCWRHLAFCLDRLSLEFLSLLASVGLCLGPLFGYCRSSCLSRQASYRPRPVRFGTNMTSPTTSTR